MGRIIRCSTGEVFTEYRDYLRNRSLNLHHLHYRNIGHEKLEDLQALCRHCHLKVHGLLKVEKKKWNWKVKLFLFVAALWFIVQMWNYGE